MARRKAELRQLLPVPVEHVTRPKDAPSPPGEQAVVEATEAIQARGEAPPPLVRDEGRGHYTLIVGDLALEGFVFLVEGGGTVYGFAAFGFEVFAAAGELIALGFHRLGISHKVGDFGRDAGRFYAQFF